MNEDPAVEPNLDAFSRIFPLPYRVAIIIVLGTWAWGANLQYLSLLRIDVPALIRYPSRVSRDQPPHHASTYNLASILTIPLIASILLFWTITQGDSASVQSWQLLPNISLLIILITFILPLRRASHSGRSRFLTTFKRICVGGIAEASDGKFGDILLADVLTSYSKVLGDLFVALCMLASRRQSTAAPDRNCGGAFVVPILIGIPSLIRLRQCLIEYKRVRRALAGGDDEAVIGWGGQHLANAAKYFSALPVLLTSALQRGTDPARLGVTADGLFHSWVFFVLLNALFSFYWDVAKDWDLTFFNDIFVSVLRRVSPAALPQSTQSLTSEHPYGLRRHRYMHTPSIYYTVIFLDLVLRCTWSIKLNVHLDHFGDLEGGIFLMELLEVFRRWVWIFFRVETEWVRNNNRGPAPDDVLLGEYDRTKMDED